MRPSRRWKAPWPLVDGQDDSRPAPLRVPRMSVDRGDFCCGGLSHLRARLSQHLATRSHSLDHQASCREHPAPGSTTNSPCRLGRSLLWALVSPAAGKEGRLTDFQSLSYNASSLFPKRWVVVFENRNPVKYLTKWPKHPY